MAKSLTFTSFEQRASELEKNNAKMLQWLPDAVKLNKASAYSIRPPLKPCLATTEFVNNVLLEAREKPLLDCIMAVEKIIGIKWVQFIAKSSS